MTGYVYVMDRAATGLKVGRSIEPFNRMVQLRGQGASAVLAVVSHRNEKAVERAAPVYWLCRWVGHRWYLSWALDGKGHRCEWCGAVKEANDGR